MMREKKKSPKWGHAIKNNRYMLGLIWKACPGIIFFAFINALLGAVYAFLFQTYLYQYALNEFQKGRSINEIMLTIAGMALFSLVYMVVHEIAAQYQEQHAPLVEAYIQKMLQKKAADVELACFERPAFYDTYIKAVGEASGRAMSVLGSVSDIIWVVFQVAAVSMLVIAIHPAFLLFAFLPFFFTVFLGKRRNRVQYNYNMANQKERRMKEYVHRTFYLSDYAKEMRLTDMWRVMLRRMRDSVSEMKKFVSQYGYKLMFFAYLFDLVYDILVYIGAIVLAAYQYLVKKNILLGDCFVVINSISNVAYNINYVGNALLRLDENSLYVDNLRDFLEYDIQIQEKADDPCVPTMQTLTLQNVTFSYEGQERPALEDINMTIRAGEKIAIVGHNGSGKSTLVKLLLRLYDPTKGEIQWNGVSIRDFRLSSYRAAFGVVFQDYRLLAATVAENVLLRQPYNNTECERVQEALQKSGMADKVLGTPKGIASTVTREFDEDGLVFSGGETQKLAIARIFAGKQEVVIMDEPTSALDPIAEQAMYQNMFEACEGKTVIFISHRLSSAVAADRIYVFEHGRIVEEGTHTVLLSLHGRYADMWYKQADAYRME